MINRGIKMFFRLFLELSNIDHLSFLIPYFLKCFISFAHPGPHFLILKFVKNMKKYAENGFLPSNMDLRSSPDQEQEIIKKPRGRRTPNLC